MARKSGFGIATWWRAEVPFGWLLMLALLSGLDAHWSLAKTAAGTTDWLDVAAQFSAGDINAQTQSAQQYSAMTISGRGLVSTVKRCNQSDDSALHGAKCTKLTLRGKHHHRVLLYLPLATGTALTNLKGQDVAFHSCEGRTIQMWGLGTKQTCDLSGQDTVKPAIPKTGLKDSKKKTVEWSRALRRLMVSNAKKRPKYIESLSTARLR